MCDETADDCLAASKLAPNWFVTSEMIQNYFTVLYVDKNILYFNEECDDSVFNCNGMGILNIDLNNINLDNNVDEDDPDIIILVKHKELKKQLSEELRSQAFHPNRWWDWSMSEDEEKEIDPIFIEEL